MSISYLYFGLIGPSSVSVAKIYSYLSISIFILFFDTVCALFNENLYSQQMPTSIYKIENLIYNNSINSTQIYNIPLLISNPTQKYSKRLQIINS